ncbi:MAG: hypothetical protein KatS3mg050_3610 [Litorilinea sp.]|nr:MAG: hypothetical protein KatS3mg050_3610 [Litorilinea sp.]
MQHKSHHLLALRWLAAVLAMGLALGISLPARADTTVIVKPSE